MADNNEQAKNLTEKVGSTGLIPDLCSLTNLFLLLILSELLALLFTILNFSLGQAFWMQLALNSLFIVWVAMSSAAILCSIRLWLNHKTTLFITLFCALLVFLNTLVSSIIALSVFFDLHLELTRSSQQWFIIRNTLPALMITLLWMRYLFLRQQILLGVKAEGDARFDALQARIQPHFLFNTLNTIASLVAIDPDKAESTIENLAALMRSSLNPSSEVIPLQQEVELCRHYIAIEQQRLGQKLQVNWHIEADLSSHTIPPFTLQPLVENAVYHGIQKISKGGTIDVVVKTDKQSLIMQVGNPLPPTPTGHGNQTAQSNIRQRLSIRYGNRAEMKVKQSEEDYSVTITIGKGEKT